MADADFNNRSIPGFQVLSLDKEAACPWDAVSFRYILKTLFHTLTSVMQNLVKKPAYDGIVAGFQS